MTTTFRSAFQQFKQRISLDPQEIREARGWRDRVSAVLAVALATTSFLPGSFARKTMRRPL